MQKKYLDDANSSIRYGSTDRNHRSRRLVVNNIQISLTIQNHSKIIVQLNEDMIAIPYTQVTLPGSGVTVVPVPLRRSDPSSPWCYAASLTPAIVIDDDLIDTDGNDGGKKPAAPQTTFSLPAGANFLATQVWPSSRTASCIIERHLDPTWTVCELGCGPGLPSLTAAKKGAANVIATDVDEFALEMVRAAALEQGFINTLVDVVAEDTDLKKQQFVTQKFDLTSKENVLPEADLYILSDVFESLTVAEGAAWHVQSLLSKNEQKSKQNFEILGTKSDESIEFNSSFDTSTETSNDTTKAKSRVWVFAQSDRAQRDSFLKKLRETYDELLPGWTTNHTPDIDANLWLFDLDETNVQYN